MTPSRKPCPQLTDQRAYRVTVAGINSWYRAASRKRATYLAARDAYEAGYGKTVGSLLMESRCVRDPNYDIEAVCGEEGHIPNLP